MIWIVGGTSEGEYFSEKLGSVPHILTLGTEEGETYYNNPHSLFMRMDEQKMEEFIKDKKIDMTVDLSHPFAVEVSENARKASESLKIPYYRYERDTTKPGKHTVVFKNYEEAFNYLKTWSGTLFVTTGSNKVSELEDARGENRFIYRILPMVKSIEKLSNLGIKLEDTVAMVGPFSVKLNEEMIKFFDADAMLMKDSGKAGGTEEKIEACENTGITSFLIAREENEHADFYEFVEKVLREIESL
jgi:precorrin-6A/cobalt-precorrin-6A reductase